MLDYKKNRVDYGEALHPPEGYQLSMAVATTYSLDLYALLCIPVALFYSRNLDGKVSENRMDILDAIQKTADSLKVYCQKGKIKVPMSQNKIISFVEDCVAEVLPENEFISFHPKIWVIRFTAEKKRPVYRVIVLSRNLTFDRSWDLAFYLEGETSRAVKPKTKPLVEYVKYLNTQSGFKDSTKFLTDLSKVDFKVDYPFTDFEFCPMGFKKWKNPLPKNWNDLLIISPFVTKGALADFASNSSGNRYLFSRREELDKVDMSTLTDFNTYCISDRIIDGEYESDEGADEEPMKQNLHAKLFIGNDKECTHWYLGSANCSDAALDRNEEFLIHLKTTAYNASVNVIKRLLLSEDTASEYFEEYERKTDEGAESSEFDFRYHIYHLLKALEAEGITSARCEKSKDDEKYDVIINIKAIPILQDNRFIIKMSVYGRDELQFINTKGANRFEQINLYNLSPFLHWSIEWKETGENKEFITKMDIELPPNRKDAIFRSLIENREKFFQFLQFLLGNDEGQLEFIKNSVRNNGVTENGIGIWAQNSPIMEELLMAASRNPSKIREINRVIQRLEQAGDESPVPPEFKEFWSVFESFANNG